MCCVVGKGNPLAISVLHACGAGCKEMGQQASVCSQQHDSPRPATQSASPPGGRSAVCTAHCGPGVGCESIDGQAATCSDRATQVAAPQADSRGFLLHLCGAAADAGLTCRLPRHCQDQCAHICHEHPACRSAHWDQPTWDRGQTLGHKVTGHAAANSSQMHPVPGSPVAVYFLNSQEAHAAHKPTEVLRPAQSC